MTIEKLRKLVVEEGTDDGHVTVPNCKELLRHERNKVLDEAIDRIPKEWNNYATLNDIIRTLESLKL